ncbi:MAG: alpha/beta hydrolase [Rhodospirillaceae bacterium]|nr:alpha/beta hydrolase [Rhodospirillaceae bacterium]
MELKVDEKTVFAATGGKEFAPSLPAVIFLHGAGMDHSIWALQTRWFAWHGYGVLAIDLPGHGKSDGPAYETIDDMAAWVVRMIDACGAEKVSLVGHSMGSLVALAAAAEAGGRLSSLVLLGTAAAMPVHPDLLAATKSNDPVAWDLIVSWGFGKPAHFGMNRAPGMWMQGGGRSLLARAPVDVLGIDMAACDAWKRAPEAAARVTCPTVIVAGDRDMMTPVKAAAPLADAIPDAKTVILKECGHIMMVERPDETLDTLIRAISPRDLAF